MADRPRMTAAPLMDKLLASEHADVLCESIAWLVAELMDAEVATLVGAELGERGPDRRTTQRNGYRPRTRDTRVGQLELAIPKLRSGIFPNDAALLRLAGMLLLEQNDEWLVLSFAHGWVWGLVGWG